MRPSSTAGTKRAAGAFGLAMACILSGAAVLAPQAAAADESLGLLFLDASDSQVQVNVCLDAGSSLPAQVSYLFALDGAPIASSTWSGPEPDAILVGTEPCPVAMGSLSIDGLLPERAYTVSVTLTLTPVVEEFAADPDPTTGFPVSTFVPSGPDVSVTAALVVSTAPAAGPDVPTEDEPVEAGPGPSSGSGTGVPVGPGEAATPGASTTPTPGDQVSVPPQPEDAFADPATFTARDLAELTPSEVAAIEPAVLAQIPPETFGVLTPPQASALTPRQMSRLRPAQIVRLKPRTVAALQPRTIKAMTAAHLRELTSRQITALTRKQLSALSPQQRALLRR